VLAQRFQRACKAKSAPSALTKPYKDASKKGKAIIMYAWALQPNWKGAALNQLLERTRTTEQGLNGEFMPAGRLEQWFGPVGAKEHMDDTSIPTDIVQGKKCWYVQTKWDKDADTIIQREQVAQKTSGEGERVAKAIEAGLDKHRALDDGSAWTKHGRGSKTSNAMMIEGCEEGTTKGTKRTHQQGQSSSSGGVKKEQEDEVDRKQIPKNPKKLCIKARQRMIAVTSFASEMTRRLTKDDEGRRKLLCRMVETASDYMDEDIPEGGEEVRCVVCVVFVTHACRTVYCVSCVYCFACAGMAHEGRVAGDDHEDSLQDCEGYCFECW
jgi:hypothetical protein